MERYKRVLLGAGLLGLSSLAGHAGESVKSENETSLKLSDDGTKVYGKLEGIDISYHIDKESNSRNVHLVLNRDNVEIAISDGGEYIEGRDKTIHAIDGKINYFCLEDSDFTRYFFCEDNGTNYRGSGLTKEETEKLREWSNEKLKEVYGICKEKFGDKLKIPYKQKKKPKRSLDDVLEDFDF